MVIILKQTGEMVTDLSNHPTQLCTFAIRTNRHTTKNNKRACLSVTAFLPTLKTAFGGTLVLRLSGLILLKDL